MTRSKGSSSLLPRTTKTSCGKSRSGVFNNVWKKSLSWLAICLGGWNVDPRRSSSIRDKQDARDRHDSCQFVACCTPPSRWHRATECPSGNRRLPDQDGGFHPAPRFGSISALGDQRASEDDYAGLVGD